MNLKGRSRNLCSAIKSGSENSIYLLNQLSCSVLYTPLNGNVVAISAVKWRFPLKSVLLKACGLPFKHPQN